MLLDKSRIFSTKSLYRFMTDRGAASKVAGIIWKFQVPLKINFFSGKFLTISFKWVKVCLRDVGEVLEIVVFVVAQKLLITFSLDVILPSLFGVLSRKSGSWVDYLAPYLICVVNGYKARGLCLLMFIFAGFGWAL